MKYTEYLRTILSIIIGIIVGLYISNHSLNDIQIINL